MKITIKDILALDPCEKYSQGRVKELWAGRKALTLGEVAQLPIPYLDRVWALTQTISVDVVVHWAAECAERVLGVYEEVYADDRPRQAVEAARDASADAWRHVRGAKDAAARAAAAWAAENEAVTAAAASAAAAAAWVADAADASASATAAWVLAGAADASASAARASARAARASAADAASAARASARAARASAADAASAADVVSAVGVAERAWQLARLVDLGEELGTE